MEVAMKMIMVKSTELVRVMEMVEVMENLPTTSCM